MTDRRSGAMNQERKARVAINGYGVIGKRVADAVAAQDDMELVDGLALEQRLAQPIELDAGDSRGTSDAAVRPA